MRSIRREVEYPGSSGTRTTLAAERVQVRRHLAGAADRPRAAAYRNNVGQKAAIESPGRRPSKVDHKVNRRERRENFRSLRCGSDRTSLERPLAGRCRFAASASAAARSLSIATTRIFPRLLACSRSRKWPGCSRSKQPLAHTTPFRRASTRPGGKSIQFAKRPVPTSACRPAQPRSAEATILPCAPTAPRSPRE